MTFYSISSAHIHYLFDAAGINIKIKMSLLGKTKTRSKTLRQKRDRKIVQNRKEKTAKNEMKDKIQKNRELNENEIRD